MESPSARIVVGETGRFGTNSFDLIIPLKEMMETELKAMKSKREKGTLIDWWFNQIVISENIQSLFTCYLFLLKKDSYDTIGFLSSKF